jgi:hypothetical protein
MAECFKKALGSKKLFTNPNIKRASNIGSAFFCCPQSGQASSVPPTLPFTASSPFFFEILKERGKGNGAVHIC